MEFIFCLQLNIKVGIIVFDGNSQTCPKYPKQKVGNILTIYKEKSIATAFVFYCDSKHSNILWGPVMFAIVYLK